MTQGKPRIRRNEYGSWVCGDVGQRGVGPTPAKAYQGWVRAGEMNYCLCKVG